VKRRKQHNPLKRVLNATDALLRKNHVVVIDIHPADKQGLLNWKSCRSVSAGRQMIDGICDLPRAWTVYLAVFCRSQSGERYMKSEEIEPQGRYRSEQISEAIVSHHEALQATCNPGHVIGYGWIASPTGESLTEEQAARAFDAVGAWEIPDRGVTNECSNQKVASG